MIKIRHNNYMEDGICLVGFELNMLFYNLSDSNLNFTILFSEVSNIILIMNG